MLAERVENVSKPCVELAWDVIGREFGEQGTRCVERDGPDLMTDIEGLYPLVVEWKMYVQGKVTWSESEMMI